MNPDMSVQKIEIHTNTETWELRLTCSPTPWPIHTLMPAYLYHLSIIVLFSHMLKCLVFDNVRRIIDFFLNMFIICSFIWYVKSLVHWRWWRCCRQLCKTWYFSYTRPVILTFYSVFFIAHFFYSIFLLHILSLTVLSMYTPQRSLLSALSLDDSRLWRRLTVPISHYHNLCGIVSLSPVYTCVLRNSAVVSCAAV